MTKYLDDNSHVKFKIVPEYPDYYEEVEGSRPGGRSIEPEKFNLLKLDKKTRKEIRLPGAQLLVFGKMMVDACEGRLLLGASLAARLRIVKMFAKFFLNPFRCFSNADTLLGMGNALVGRLRMSLSDRDIPVWVNTTAKRLISENDRIIGLEAEKNGKPIRIRAERGVIFAAGGFEKNPAMRKQYHNESIYADWSLGIPENTGDAINMGLEMGAEKDMMDHAWWMPTTLIPGDCMPWYTKDTGCN